MIAESIPPDGRVRLLAIELASGDVKEFGSAAALRRAAEQMTPRSQRQTAHRGRRRLARAAELDDLGGGLPVAAAENNRGPGATA